MLGVGDVAVERTHPRAAIIEIAAVRVRLACDSAEEAPRRGAEPSRLAVVDLALAASPLF